MIGLEFAFLFGSKRVRSNVGCWWIIWWFGSSGTTHYWWRYVFSLNRAVGSKLVAEPLVIVAGGSALTSDADDDKRIIENSTGTLTRTQMDTLYGKVLPQGK